MKIQIDKQYMIHESGTKFYQTMRITVIHDDGRRNFATVMNWGKQVGEHDIRQMIRSGEIGWKTGNLYNATIKVKQGRGYASNKVADGTTNSFRTKEAFVSELTGDVGAIISEAIVFSLGFPTMSSESSSTPAISEEDKVSSPAKMKPAETYAAASTEGWGEF